MKRLDLRWTAVLCCTLCLIALPAVAERPLTVDVPVADAGEPDWLPIAEGVWQRSHADGRVQTRIEGQAGLAWALPSMRLELEALTRAFLDDPSGALEEDLEAHLAVIDQMEALLAGKQPEAGRDGGLDHVTAASCTRTFTVSASAGPIQCGATGSASSSYSTNCSEQCTVYARGLARKVCSGTTTTNQQTCSNTGTNVSCSSSAQINHPFNSCYSEGYAYIFCPALNNLLIEEFDSNTTCNTGGGFCLACLQQVPRDL